MKTRWKILIGLGVFFMLVGLSTMISVRFQPENQLVAYKKFLRNHGEKLEISEVAPPPVPAASNSVDAVEAAISMFGLGHAKIPDAMKMVAPGKAMTAWRQPDVHGYGYDFDSEGYDSGNDFSNSWNDFAASVAVDQPAIDLLHQVLDRPRLDFELDYRKGVDISAPHLHFLIQAAQKLEAAAVLDLHNDDPGAATTNILTMLALAQRDTSEVTLISHLVRIAMASIAVAPTWELLQATNVTDVQLAAVQNEWQQMDFLSDAEHAFEMTRAWGVDVIQKARVSHEEFQNFYVPGTFSGGYASPSGSGIWPLDWEALTEKPRHAVAEAMWRSSWSYTGERRILQSVQIILEALRVMQTNRSQLYQADYEAMRSRLSSLGTTHAGEAFFQALKIPDLSDMLGFDGISSVVEKAIRTQTACRITVTAIALKRFQLQHRKWPDTLADLVPEFISSVPTDPYDGKPLRYHPKADGTYLLYSVAEDGVDDGGDPTLPSSARSSSLSWQDDRARDWVWPQPVTPAEIQYFREHPPK